MHEKRLRYTDEVRAFFVNPQGRMHPPALGAIEALQDSENERVDRLVKLVGASVLTVNEVRAGRGLGSVDWGDRPAKPAAREREGIASV